MILCDVNILVYAHRPESPRHEEFRSWLEGVVHEDSPFAMSELVFSAFVRVVTHPRVFRDPTPLPVALDFCSALRDRGNCRTLLPGPRHWDLFRLLCLTAGARGNLVADAYHASLAIEHGCEWITADRDFARFPGLHWRHPLDHF